ncbi:MAG TPA: methylenetetrahydrofolate reductase [Stellaceae bacterium]|jgi:methylenetetrahydrofolate reductase (NADPH)|nr:methylenetetrahydrofolate reductase [Stellaceae bacterium]
MLSSDTSLDHRHAHIRDLVRSASLEMTARAAAANDLDNAGLSPGTPVYITALPNDSANAVLATALRVHQMGLTPVPHLGARYVTDLRQFETLLRALVRDAGVDQVLVIGGDIDRPRGPYASSLDLLRSGVFEGSGIRRIGLAAYPEGHASIASDVLDRALEEKIAQVRTIGLDPYIVSQFSFSAAPIIAWLTQMARQFADVPIHVGIAGPASMTTLVKFGLACGIGASLRALRKTSIRQLADAPPDTLVTSLAEAGGKIAGLHFFTFGGIARTAVWMRRY